MSVTASLNNAISGLTASARMAEVVSSNLSNALTDGYGRRVVDLSAANNGGQGAGVRVDGVRRVVDQGIISDRRLAEADLSANQQNARYLTAVEQAIGLPGDPGGLSGRLNAFESALIDASSDPSSSERLRVVTTRLNEVTNVFAQASGTIQGLRQDADGQIAQDVATLNLSLLQVEQLNSDISRALGSGLDATALLDARQKAVDNLAEIVPIREVPRDRGAIALITKTGATLLDGKAATIGFEQTPTIVADMGFETGTLNGITINGEPASVTNGVGRLDGGRLGSSFQLRDNDLVAAQAGLDRAAADLIQRFEDPNIDPTVIPGSPGLLTDNATAYDPLLLTGLAFRIAVNPAVDPTVGGDVTLLRDGVAAVTRGPVGNTSQMNLWVTALSSLQSYDGGVQRSAFGQISNLASNFGLQRVQSDDQVTFSAARWDTLRMSELSGGVDSDQELQKLIRIEQSYAANAKLIQTIDSMIRTLMEI